MGEYSSSEEFQWQRSVFADKTPKKEANTTETDKIKKILDLYIAKHSKTTTVRALSRENPNVAKYGVGYQLDLSADIVEILEKIKSELR